MDCLDRYPLNDVCLVNTGDRMCRQNLNGQIVSMEWNIVKTSSKNIGFNTDFNHEWLLLNIQLHEKPYHNIDISQAAHKHT